MDLIKMDQEELIYHYTSIAGLHGIINSRSVWASDCRFLNDQKELIQAIKMFLNKFDEDSKKILSHALFGPGFSLSHCVFSLSRSPRVLSQWRSYGDDGRGAAIGFVRKYLKGLGKTSNHLLVDCIYDDHEGFLDSVIERCREDIEALRMMYFDANKAINSFFSLIDDKPKPLSNLYGELLKVKNPAFKEEQEVRLVISVPRKQVQTRVANGLIVPFVEHRIIDSGDEDYLCCVAPEIWFGPKSDKRNVDALKVFGQDVWNIKGIHHYDCGYI